MGVRTGRHTIEFAHVFACDQSSGHPLAGAYTRMQAPEPADLPEISGLEQELRLDVELPVVLAKHGNRWVEYGVVELAYAAARLLTSQPWWSVTDTAIKATRYSASSFLAATFGRLSRTGQVLFHWGPATGRWAYNSQISWWAVPPEPDWSTRTSWVDIGEGMGYVPGSTE